MKRSIIFIILAFVGHCCAAQQETLTWSDEFNGTGAPDPAKWGYDLGSSGWGNNEIQNYTNLTQNARQENGSLIIEALRQGNGWTSARLLTNNKFEFRYGRVVFRAKLPVGIGTWPALWMLGENFSWAGWPACGEIDIMEHVGKDPGMVHSSVHSPSSYGATVNTAKKYIGTFNTEFHTYELRWTYEKLEFSIDSVLFYTYKPAVRNASTWPFDKPFFIIMNIAMGGNWGSDPQYETGGLKNGIEPSLTSAKMEIDYVRVYQYPAAIDDSKGSNDGPGPGKSFLFPNPADDKVLVDVPPGTRAEGAIFDLCGKKVRGFTVSDPGTEIDLTGFPHGIYCLTLLTGGKTSMNKLIIN